MAELVRPGFNPWVGKIPWRREWLPTPFSSVQSLSRPQELQHARPPCPSPTPGVHPNSCALSQWCHPTISCSTVPFFCLQSFPESGSFPLSCFFASGGQSIGASSSAAVFPMNIQGWFDFLQSKELSRVFSSTTVWKYWSYPILIYPMLTNIGMLNFLNFIHILREIFFHFTMWRTLYNFPPTR